MLQVLLCLCCQTVSLTITTGNCDRKASLLATSTKSYSVKGSLAICCFIELGNRQVVCCRAKPAGAPANHGVIQVLRLDRYFFRVQPESEAIVAGILNRGRKRRKGDVDATALKCHKHAT